MFRALSCVLLLSGLLASAAAQTCTTSWAGPVSGSWSSDANWTAGAPDGADVACITVDGDYTVTLDRNQALSGLVVGGTTGAQTLEVRATLSSLGEGLIRPSGRIETYSSANCADCDGLPLVTDTLTVEGTLIHRDQVGLLSQGGTLDVAPGGTLVMYSTGTSASMGNGAEPLAHLRLRGRLRVESDHPSRTPRLRNVGMDLDGGRLEVAAGALEMGGRGTWHDVTVDVAEGAALSMRPQTGEMFVLSGTLGGQVDGIFQVAGGSLGVNAATVLAAGAGDAVLDLRGAGLRVGSPRVELRSAGGSFVNRGRLVFNAVFITVNGVDLLNEGTVEMRLWGPTLDASVLRNAPGALLDLVDGNSAPDIANGGRVENAGLLRVRRDTQGALPRLGGKLWSEPGSEIRIEPGGEIELSAASPALPAGVQVTGEGGLWLRAGLAPEATISPGTAEAPFGTLVVREQWQLAPAARFVADLGADGQADRIVAPAGSNTRLGGTLVLRLQPGYVPRAGDRFVLYEQNVNQGTTPWQGAFEAVEVEGEMPPGVRFVAEAPAPGRVIVRVVAEAAVTASAVATAEDGGPVTVTVSVESPAAPGQALAVPLAFGGGARRYDDYVTDLSGSTLRIPPGETQGTVTLFPLRDALDEGTETVVVRLLAGGDVLPPAVDSVAVALADGPPTTALSVAAVAPVSGGDAGFVTASVLGQALGEGAQVRLVRGGTVLPGAGVLPGAEGNGVRATFDLRDAPLGVYDVVVEQGGQTATLPGAFTVEPHRDLLIWADIVGTPSPRIGRWSTYTLYLGNSGNADVFDVSLVLRLTSGLEFEILEGVRDLPDLPAAEQELVLEAVADAQVIPLWFPRLPAGSVQAFRVRVRPPLADFSIGDGVGVAYELYPPDPDNAFTWTGDWNAAVPSNYGLLWGVFGAYTRHYPPGTDATWAPAAARVLDEDDGDNDWTPREEPPLVQEETVDDLVAQYGQGHRFNSYYGSATEPSTSTAVQEYGGFATGQLLSNATRSAGYASSATAVGGVTAAYTIRSYGLKSQRILNDRCWTPPCGGGSGGSGAGAGASGGTGRGANGGPGAGSAGGKGGGSADPNDKLGPSGEGNARHYTAEAPARYTIRFENLDTVPFPAQEVVIVDTLDAAVFDLSTFSLGPIAFGRRTLTPPPGLQRFTAEVSLAPGLPASLLVHAALDPASGRATWTFTTLDPATRDLPEDGLVGFLPPNVSPPEGEGSVSFTVRPHPGLPTGTRVENRAEIVFDVNEPIVTPRWTNTVDATPPVSAVQPLGAGSASPVTVAVAGSDLGAGIFTYGLYVSEDGGPFELRAWSDQPTFVFEGELGRTYGFYSRATDHVLNVEPPKADPEAVTTITAVDAEGAPDLPAALTLDVPAPNPARARASVRLGLPAPAAVSLRVFDLLGREVLHAAEADLAAGWHVLPVETGRLASGAYVLRVQTGAEVRLQRFSVVR